MWRKGVVIKLLKNPKQIVYEHIRSKFILWLAGIEPTSECFQQFRQCFQFLE